MATKKKAAKKRTAKKKAPSISARLNQILRFRREWIIDPAPELRRQLSLAGQRQLDLVKREFAERVNAIIKQG